MLDKKLYESYLVEIENHTLDEKEIEELNKDIMNLLIQYNHTKNYDEIEKEIKSAKRFIGLFRKCITSWLSYQIGFFSAIITIFELMIGFTIRKEIFHKEMTGLYVKSGVKDILEYIYKNPDSQHKVICEKTCVKNKSYLSQLLKQLENVGCVERYSVGKTSFFSLSTEGQAFVKEKQRPKKTGEHYLLIGKYELDFSDNWQEHNIEDVVSTKYKIGSFDRKYKNYA